VGPQLGHVVPGAHGQVQQVLRRCTTATGQPGTPSPAPRRDTTAHAGVRVTGACHPRHGCVTARRPTQSRPPRRRSARPGPRWRSAAVGPRWRSTAAVHAAMVPGGGPRGGPGGWSAATTRPRRSGVHGVERMTGFEPATSTLARWRSSQLSYIRVRRGTVTGRHRGGKPTGYGPNARSGTSPSGRIRRSRAPWSRSRRPPRRRVEGGHLDDRGMPDRLQEQLGDAVPTGELDRLGAEVDE
jgi:hypothetical protein